MADKKQLDILSEIFPDIAKASTEIINLQAIINLPKGTEHFVSDIHGEYDAFSHVLRNGSGTVKRKIEDVFGDTLTIEEKKDLATLIYYPERRTLLKRDLENNLDEWYRITIPRLVQICKKVSTKYSRSKVRKALPPDFAYIIEELISNKKTMENKEAYYDNIINTIIDIKRARECTIALCNLIQRLVVDHLHVVGDIYDRGPYPNKIMDLLMNHHSIDIEWGNHDILWMGAAAGQPSCIANVVRICSRYGNLDLLEDSYGINLLPLATFAMSTYEDDPCLLFKTKGEALSVSRMEKDMNMKMHKAISIIQFKLEGQLIDKHPEWNMPYYRVFDRVDFKNFTYEENGVTYPLEDHNFPTINPDDPYKFTKEEEQIVSKLQNAFTNCKRLQEHISFLLKKGSLYKIYNQNLLYHGCVPLEEDGSLSVVNIYGQTYSGKALYDVLDKHVRRAFLAVDEEMIKLSRDMMWWIWCGKDSPLFGKSKMATFERYFINDKTPHKEIKNAYYKLQNNKDTVYSLLREFGLDPENPNSHIINGHVPVHTKDGESPVKCDGKLFVIDGGFSKAYQPTTGIAGYTLISNSMGLRLVEHEPFSTIDRAIKYGLDIKSDTVLVQESNRRQYVGDTDIGIMLKERIDDLKDLLNYYRTGEFENE